MRLLAVCDSPPTLDAAVGNGSTLIPAHLLPRLSPDVHVDLLWFADRAVGPDQAVLARCDTVRALRLRTNRAALAAMPVTGLPRASWQRAGARDAVRRLAGSADVVYLHGLHVFALGLGQRTPVLAHEVDPWSHYWQQRADHGSGPRAAYDRGQARRARRLEQAVGATAAEYVVVNHDDAVQLSGELGRPVTGLPNGVDLAHLGRRDPAAEEPDLLVFVGTLDYPPNVAAVCELAHEVLPLVRRSRPGAHLVIAGRRPVEAVLRLQSETVEVLGAVDDVRAVFARAAVAVYPGTLGRGTKNTVLEALAVGCPVVASPEAARGLPAGEHAALGRGPAELGAEVVALLSDDHRRRSAGAAAAVLAAGLADWDVVAASFEVLLHATAASAPRH